MSDIEEQALGWATRQAAGQLDAHAQAEFDAWHAANPRHQGAYLRIRALQHTFDHVSVQDSLKPRAEPAGTQSAEPAPTRSGRRALLFSGALAAGLAALAVGPLRPMFAPREIYTTARGEFRKVPLADHSVVSMNGGSELHVSLGASERRIVLHQGEAWFEVAKDRSRPFIVESGGVRVRAVGTAFAVRRYRDGADVLVTEGVVEVWRDGAAAGIKRMAAGGHAYVGGGAGDIAAAHDAAAIERRLAWRSGRLVFDNQTLASAAAEFNRYNGRQIVVADAALGRRTVVGQYRTDQPERFAEDVRALFRVPVAIAPDRIVIGAAGATR